jgi:inosose dehydratase
LPTDPGRLRDELAARGLGLVGAFVPVAFAEPSSHAPGLEAAVRTAQLMCDAGARDAFIVLSDDNARVPEREANAGRVGAGHGLTGQQWDTFAAGVTHAARAVRDRTGLRTVFHPHCGGYVETQAEIDALMARSDPSVLGLLLDTGHLLYGGADPLDVLARYAPRIWHVHFKDCDLGVAQRSRDEGLGYLAAVRAQLFCELGTGGVDFPAVIAALGQQAYDGWAVVEQDVFPGYGTPSESARRSRRYLASLGL